MPIIDVSVVQGRDERRLRDFIAALHAAAVDTLGAPPETVRVILREVPPTRWASGGKTIAEKHVSGS